MLLGGSDEAAKERVGRLVLYQVVRQNSGWLLGVDFTKAARLDEHYSQPCFQLGKAAWANKDYRVAAGWLARVDRSDPHYLEAQFLLGLCRYYSGDFAAAEQSFELVGSSVPLNEVYNNLGAAEARRNNLAGATANFQKALEGDASDPDYYFNLGYAYWLSGKYAEAAASFRDTLERNDRDTEATAHRVAAEIGIEEVLAEVLPSDKAGNRQRVLREAVHPQRPGAAADDRERDRRPDHCRAQLCVLGRECPAGSVLWSGGISFAGELASCSRI